MQLDRSVSDLSPPAHADEVTFLIVVQGAFAFVGVMQSVRNPTRQVKVRGFDHNRIRMFLDAHDPMERMFRVFLLFMVPRELNQLVPVLQREGAGQRDDSGGVIVPRAMTRLAEFLMGIERPRGGPGPTALAKNRFAIRAKSRLRQFVIGFVRVMNVFVRQAILPRRHL
jgi:hypothetical protein